MLLKLFLTTIIVVNDFLHGTVLVNDEELEDPQNFISMELVEVANSTDGTNDLFSSTEINSIDIPHRANCMPELRTIRIMKSNPNFLYVPSCTRIERCGGCCLRPLYSCKPTVLNTVKYMVFKINIGGTRNASTATTTREIVELNKHISCKCSPTTPK